MPDRKRPKKIVVITRCQDCPVDGCESRTLCGDIPAECPLPAVVGSEDAVLPDELTCEGVSNG